ncbi:hypothetical protein FZ938_20330 [Azospirillum oryzae]|nr:hypothetical protein FZ938_20330 [Azospirillum oryzae]
MARVQICQFAAGLQDSETVGKIADHREGGFKASDRLLLVDLEPQIVRQDCDVARLVLEPAAESRCLQHVAIDDRALDHWPLLREIELARILGAKPSKIKPAMSIEG